MFMLILLFNVIDMISHKLVLYNPFRIIQSLLAKNETLLQKTFSIQSTCLYLAHHFGHEILKLSPLLCLIMHLDFVIDNVVV